MNQIEVGGTRMKDWDPNLVSVQHVKPEVVSEKRWGEEYEKENSDQNLSWNGSTLSIQLKYSGGCQHQFKVYLREITSDGQYLELLIEDQKKDDYSEGIRCTVIQIDLKEYVKPGMQFVVRKLGWGNSAIRVGDSTFADTL